MQDSYNAPIRRCFKASDIVWASLDVCTWPMPILPIINKSQICSLSSEYWNQTPSSSSSQLKNYIPLSSPSFPCKCYAIMNVIPHAPSIMWLLNPVLKYATLNVIPRSVLMQTLKPGLGMAMNLKCLCFLEDVSKGILRDLYGLFCCNEVGLILSRDIGVGYLMRRINRAIIFVMEASWNRSSSDWILSVLNRECFRADVAAGNTIAK